MKRLMVCCSILSILFITSIAECRVGGGRSFGNRGSRGFSNSGNFGGMNRSSGYRSYEAPRPVIPPTTPQYTPNNDRSVFWKSMGAGVAGGFLGGMLSRSLGWNHYGSGPYPSGSGGGIGILEMLLIAGLLYFLFRMFFTRSQSLPTSNGAAQLMRQAKDSTPSYSYSSFENEKSGETIEREKALDLFFEIQGSWGQRDLRSVDHLLDLDVKEFLEKEIQRLKASKRINRLENIAVRETDVVESWKEGNRNYSTVRFFANLIDVTVDEETNQVLEGSRTQPIKFEEYWTFFKEDGSSSWKLSAIQQS